MNLTNTDKSKKSPQRMCIVCRQTYDKRNLLRIVKSSDGVVTVDIGGKANGRGAYICGDEKCISKCAKGYLSKHLGCEIPSEIFEEITAHYEKR